MQDTTPITVTRTQWLDAKEAQIYMTSIMAEVGVKTPAEALQKIKEITQA